ICANQGQQLRHGLYTSRMSVDASVATAERTGCFVQTGRRSRSVTVAERATRTGHACTPEHSPGPSPRPIRRRAGTIARPEILPAEARLERGGTGSAGARMTREEGAMTGYLCGLRKLDLTTACVRDRAVVEGAE
ncbi:hypothetical protein C8T65DRAFT_675973, partial [Cerioporus squamosus]